MTAQYLSRRRSLFHLTFFLLLFMTVAGAKAQVATNLLNINFGGGSKVGLSGTGLATNDTWNVILGSANYTTNNLLWANATTSSVSVTFTNLPWNNPIYGLDDGMLSTYVSGTAFDFGESVVVPAVITISNLPPSTYKVYAYGVGADTYYEYEGFGLSVGTNSYGTKWTGNSYDPTTEPLTENLQYVVFTNVVVTNGQILTLDLTGVLSHTVNGLQILDVTPVPTLPSVTFDPISGSIVPVTLTLAVPGHTNATIYYTLNGSTPTTASSVYSTPLSLTVQTTVKAFATETNYLDSPLATAYYLLPTAPVPDVYPSSGSSSNNSMTVTISSSLSGSTLIYSFDAYTWYEYAAPFTIYSSCTLYAKTTKSGYYDSSAATRNYTVILPFAATPVVSPSGGTNNNTVQVLLSSSLEDAVLQWSTNSGSAWNNFDGAVVIERTRTLLARGTMAGYSNSPIVTNVYTMVVADSVANPPGGVIGIGSQDITLSNPTIGAALTYSLNGGSPTAYTGTFQITNSASVQVVGSRSGFTSRTNTFAYYLVTNAADTILNLNFGASNRVGTAATGYSTNDAWNIIGASTNVLQVYTNHTGSPITTTLAYTTHTNLLWANGSNSILTVSVTNLFTTNYYAPSDAMLKTALVAPLVLVDDSWDIWIDEFTYESTNVYIESQPKVVVSNLPTNTYDIYIYGTEFAMGGAGFRVKVGTNSYSAWKGTDYDYYSGTTNWVENDWYVKFTNIIVNSAEDLIVDVGPGSSVYLINGMQVVPAHNAPLGPTVSPAVGIYTNKISVTVSNVAATTQWYRFGDGDWNAYSGPIYLMSNAVIQAHSIFPGNVTSRVTTVVYTFPDTDGDGLTDAYENEIGTNPNLADTDYDGRTDGQEVADGTDPLSVSSVLPFQLAQFRFDTTNWLGEAGQIPLVATNLQLVTSWATNALSMTTTNAAKLIYRDVEADLVPNITLQQGTVRFWFKPDWSGTNTNSGVGPGVWSRLIEVGEYSTNATYGQWSIGLNPEGTQIRFSTQGDGVETNHFNAGITFASNIWHQIAITYTPTNSILYVDGIAVTNGVGVTHYPGAAVRAEGISVGSDRNGYSLAYGSLDELDTYNVPLTAEDIFASYEEAIGRDRDGDGISDIVEHQSGGNLSISDRPFTVRITYPKGDGGQP